MACVKKGIYIYICEYKCHIIETNYTACEVVRISVGYACIYECLRRYQDGQRMRSMLLLYIVYMDMMILSRMCDRLITENVFSHICIQALRTKDIYTITKTITHCIMYMCI